MGLSRGLLGPEESVCPQPVASPTVWRGITLDHDDLQAVSITEAMRGLAEIGIIGVAAAILNAVFRRQARPRPDDHAGQIDMTTDGQAHERALPPGQRHQMRWLPLVRAPMR
jgi:hypothetical protein